ncbi:MAG: holo-ACP synthase [Syntrophales bacterium]|nr:holo-ACP synthase [Syntrophales bacterium]
MIIGIGIDVIEIRRIKAAVHRWGDRFLRRVFTTREIEYCGRKQRPALHFAARFAAKEAVMKCLGTGMRGIAFRDIEVVNNVAGKPDLHIDRDLRAVLKDDVKYPRFHLSITHSDYYAAAVVVLEADDPVRGPE